MAQGSYIQISRDVDERVKVRLQNLSEADRALLARVERRCNNELLFGLKYHVMRRAFIDLAYYNGFQHVFWDNKRHRLRQIPAAANRARVTDNKIMPACQRAFRILTHNISFQVRPKDSDYRSRAEARMGERAIRHLYRTKRWARKIRQMAQWCVTTGCAFLRPYYNPHIGPRREFFFDASGQPIPPEELSEEAKVELRRAGMSRILREGDVDIGVHSVFDVYVPDTAVDTDDLQWYIIAQRRSLNWIRERWPKNGQLVKPEDFTAWERNTFEARILSMAGGSAEAGFQGLAGSIAYDDDKSAIVKTYVEPPSEDNPRGVYVVTAGGIILEKGDSPSFTFGLNGCDLVKFDFIPRPGSFWPISLPENMISQQRMLNSAQGQIADMRRTVIKPKVFIPKGATIQRNAFSDATAEIIEIDTTKGEPHWAPFPNLPPGLFASVEMHLNSLRDLSAQHEAMQGQNPSGVRAGYAINLLRERDMEFYQPIIDSHAEAYEVLWSHVHQLIKRTWRTPRLVQEIARSELVWSGFISGDDLAENARVVVEPTDMYPRSAAARQAFASEFLQFGQNLMLFPPLLRATIMEAMELGDEQKIKEIFELDVRWAEYAIETMIGDPEKGIPGQDVAVRPGIDDHATILQVVRNFQKTRYYDQLPPETKLRIERYARGQAQMLIQGALLEGAAMAGQQGASNEQEQRTQSATE